MDIYQKVQQLNSLEKEIIAEERKVMGEITPETSFIGFMLINDRLMQLSKSYVDLAFEIA